MGPTESTPEPALKTYAEVAVQVSPTMTYVGVAVQASTTSSVRKRKDTEKGKAKAEVALGATPHMETVQAIPLKRQNTLPELPLRTHAIVMHAAPLHYKPGTMRRWIEEDNKDMGVEIMGIRWLLKENRPGKVASSLVIYMKSARKVEKLRMGRRFFRTTSYDWDRISTRRYQLAMPSTRPTTSMSGPMPCDRHGLPGHCMDCPLCGGKKARKGERQCGACGGEGWFIP